MIYRYDDGAGDLEEAFPLSTYGSRFGVVKVYRLMGQVFFEMPDVMLGFKDQFKNEILPDIAKQLGLPIRKSMDTVKARTRLGKYGRGTTKRS